jgi:hypothetical protein
VWGIVCRVRTSDLEFDVLDKGLSREVRSVRRMLLEGDLEEEGAQEVSVPVTNEYNE